MTTAMRLRWTLALAPLFAAPSAMAAAEIRVIDASPGVVGQFEMLELSLDLSGEWEWDNPYDPEEIDITAHFTAPSGRVCDVPAFWYQPTRSSVVPPRELRKRVTRLALGLPLLDWTPGAQVELLVDDVALLNADGGERTILADFEDTNAVDWAVWGEGECELSDEIAHTGEHSMRFSPRTGDGAQWVALGGVLPESDWSEYDGLSVWVYPKSATPIGSLHLSFGGVGLDVTPQHLWASAELTPNAWNHLEWGWDALQASVRLEPIGEPGWRVRFTPTEVGAYTYHLTAQNRQATARTQPSEFAVRESGEPGFVRVSRDDPHYFVFDSGQPYFPIGHDVHGYRDALSDAITYFPKMAANGEDCTYVMMFPGDLSLGIEWGELGRYDPLAAARLDRYIDLATQYGILFKLSFDAHCSLRPSSDWGSSPYNAALGGPCAEPNDFYTNAEAERAYQKRLRYILARWGYSPTIMAWEFFSEIDGATQLAEGLEGWGYPGTPTTPPHARSDEISAMLSAWLRKMSTYVREMDPYDHVITESFGGDTADPVIWNMPEIEYTQLHHYNSFDTAPVIGNWCRELVRDYAKPAMVTEFGWSTTLVGDTMDPTGICLHNGIWASVMGGAAGSAMIYMSDRIDRLDLYHHFPPLRAFVADVPWPQEGFEPAEATVGLAERGDDYLPLVVPAVMRWSEPSVDEFTILPEGVLADAAQVLYWFMVNWRVVDFRK